MFIEGHLGTWAIEITQLTNYQNKTSLMRYNYSHLKFLVYENTDFNPFWINFKNLSQPFFLLIEVCCNSTVGKKQNSEFMKQHELIASNQVLY